VDARDLRQEVRRAARGDGDSAGLLFDHYYPRVYRYALSKLGRAQDAEDVAAETFARVLRRLDRFRWRGAGFEAWIFRIAYNLIVDQYRGSGREELSEESDERSENVTPEDLYFQTETASELSKMLSKLSDDQREVLLLRFVAGLETDEITKVMGRSSNAIRQLQFRALDSLRKQLPQGSSHV
jgi:RNA polymerase sigma-70 factor (ECF subfamily)